MEIAFESFQKRLIPIELLDMLSFKDILMIRQPILDSSFQDRYDKLVTTVINGVKSNKKSFLFNIGELGQICSRLESTFKAVFDEEIPKYLKKQAIKNTKELGGVSSSLALGALGFIPIYGIIPSAIGMVKDARALFVNVNQTFSSLKSINDMNKYVLLKENLLKKRLSRFDISGKSEFLDVIELLSTLISSKMKL
jgi:hypothetical protein